jgi:uncharacterized protein (DUF1330 family)
MPGLRARRLLPSADAISRGTAAAYEAGQRERIVISEFPSVERAIAAHDRSAYQEALRALGNGAVRDLRIV